MTISVSLIFQTFGGEFDDEALEAVAGGISRPTAKLGLSHKGRSTEDVAFCCSKIAVS